VSIQVNPQALYGAANVFSAAAEALEAKLRRLDGTARSLVEGPEAWSGEGANAFLARWQATYAQASQAVEALNQTATELHTLATKIQNEATGKWWKIALGAGLVLATGVLIFVDAAQAGLDPVTDGATAATAEEAGAVLSSALAGVAAADAEVASAFDAIAAMAQRIASLLAPRVTPMLANAGVNVGLDFAMSGGKVTGKSLLMDMAFAMLPGGKAGAEAVSVVEDTIRKSFDQEVESILKNEEVQSILKQLGREGMTKEEFHALCLKPLEAPGTLTELEQALIQKVRSFVTIEADTPMQKIIDEGTALRYLRGEFDTIIRFVTRQQDVSMLDTESKIKPGLRLDYNSPKHPYGLFDESWRNPYLNEDGTFNQQPVYALRFTASRPESYTVPYEFHDIEKLKEEWPFTGTGFTGSEEHLIPEFTIPNTREDAILLRQGIKMVKISSEGETLAARYVGKGKWEIFDHELMKKIKEEH
jgi:WXG100 family type VII secretion target